MNGYLISKQRRMKMKKQYSAIELSDNDFINFQDDFYNLLEKYGVTSIDVEHPQFKSICDLRNKVAEFIEQEKSMI